VIFSRNGFATLVKRRRRKTNSIPLFFTDFCHKFPDGKEKKELRRGRRATGGGPSQLGMTTTNNDGSGGGGLPAARARTIPSEMNLMTYLLVARAVAQVMVNPYTNPERWQGPKGEVRRFPHGDDAETQQQHRPAHAVAASPGSENHGWSEY
jgi:hypothetical protein